PEPFGLGNGQLDRHTVDGHAHRATVGLLEHRHDLWERSEAFYDGPRILRRADDGQALTAVAPAAHVPSRLAVQRLRHTSEELPLEFRKLRDLSGVDELAEPAFDTGPDPPQLAHAAGPNELGDRQRRTANRLRRAAVGAGRVRVCVAELE